ncbi:hypothetical protein CAEBREN_12625 [Caenorhabditis brenneri]|uniref:Uncharacterized protein n=1 Tax=Caenorhabditis brenneri TaxID=135651 RepID=G0PCF7_CAEBE|nr:hypothetical protein CAEBREN_12625 [Caenorhabditis brenneri]
MKIVFLVLLCLFCSVNAFVWPDCVDNDPMCTKKGMVCGYASEGATVKHCVVKCETDEQCDDSRRCVSGGCQMKPRVAQDNFI